MSKIEHFISLSAPTKTSSVEHEEDPTMTRNRSLFRPYQVLTFLVATGGFGSPALAHSGHLISIQNAVLEAFLHPLLGLDHLAAAIAVGVWATMHSRNVKQALWVPTSFVGILIVGALLSMLGWQTGGIEAMIAVSVLILGLLITTQLSFPIWVGALLCGGFALFHGLAHGSELLVTTSGVSSSAPLIIAGFAGATTLLHLGGIALGLVLRRHAGWLTRVAGAGVAVFGMWLLAS